MDNNMTSRVVKNSFWKMAVSAFGRFGGFIFTIILTRILLPEKFGIYSLVISVTALFMTIADLGVNPALLTFFSKNLNKPKKANAIFNYLLKIKLVIVSLSSIILLISSFFLAKYLFQNPLLILPLILSSFYLFFFSLSGFFSSFFYMHQKVKLDFVKEIIFQTVRTLSVLILFIFISEKYHLSGAFFCMGIAAVSSFIFAVFYSKKLSPFLFSKSKSKVNQREMLNFLFYILLGSLSLIVFSEIDTLMLGILVRNMSFIGYYSSYFALILGATGLLNFGTVLLPVFSLFKKGRVKTSIKRVFRILYMIIIPSTIGFLILGKYFIKLFFGPEYLAGILILYFSSLLIFSDPITAVLTSLFTSERKPKILAKLLFISTIMNIILNYILIRVLLEKSILLATLGAAIATILSRYLLMFLLAYYSKKELKITISFGEMIKPLISSIIMGIVVYSLTKTIDVNIFTGILIIISGVVVYVGIMFLIKGITSRDLMDLNLFKK